MQLEPGSIEGTASLAEHCIRLRVQFESDKTWSDRSEKEDKIVMNRYETLTSTADRLSRETANLKPRKVESAASSVATSSRVAPSAMGYQRLRVGSCREHGGRWIKAINPIAQQNKLAWDVIDTDQEKIDYQMMACV